MRDTPLAEVTLRRYEKPGSLDKRDLVKKFCLSMGLLQPGDGRDVIVDVLAVLLEKRKERESLGSEEVRELVKKHRSEHGLKQSGVASSNIRRQLKRLRDVMIVEKMLNNYRITEYADLHTIMTDKIERYLLHSLLTRVKEYVKKVDEMY